MRKILRALATGKYTLLAVVAAVSAGRESVGLTAVGAIARTIPMRQVSYGHNANNLAIRVTDSGRTDRPDLWDKDVLNNTLLSGETITGCGLPDDVVLCWGNTP